MSSLAWIGLALLLCARQTPAVDTGATPAQARPQPEEARQDAPEAALAAIDAAIVAGELDRGRALLSEAVAKSSATQVGSDETRYAALFALRARALQLGCLAEESTLLRAMLEVRQRLLPPEHPGLLEIERSLAATLYALGDLRGAHDLFERVLAACACTLPEGHRLTLSAKAGLAATTLALGDTAKAIELFEQVYSACLDLPPDDPELLLAKLNLAAAKLATGDYAGARELFVEVHEAYSRLRPPDDQDLLLAKQNLAAAQASLGELDSADELLEQVLASLSRLLPGDHPDLLRVKGNLAALESMRGDVAAARELKEEVLAAKARLLPADHPELLAAKLSLAVTRSDLGDQAGARELEEEVLEIRSRLLPPDHPDILRAKGNLAVTRKTLGDLAGARELEEEVLEVRQRSLAPDHPDLLAAKHGLASTKAAFGDFAGAHELFAEVLAARTLQLPPDHPACLAAQLNLAVAKKGLGDLAGARDLMQAAFSGYARLLPPDHPHLLQTAEHLASTQLALGDTAGAQATVAILLAGERVRAHGLRTESPRAAREGARSELKRLLDTLAKCAASDAEGRLTAGFFEVLESLRMVSVASPEVVLASSSGPELFARRNRIANVRGRLNDLVAAPPSTPQDIEDWRKSILEASAERDQEERGLRTELGRNGAFVDTIEVAALARRLDASAAAVAYFRYTRSSEEDPQQGEVQPRGDALLAFVVHPAGNVQRIELGPMAAIEARTDEWRRALGQPIERGIGVVAGGRAEAEVGRELRALVLDPVLTAAGTDVRELHVVPDDVLHLVPLDALPLAKDERVGDRLRILQEVSFWRLVAAPAPALTSGTLVALGGADFDGIDEHGAQVVAAAMTPPLAERDGAPAHFEPLRQTRFEVEDIAAQFAERFETKPVLLSGRSASKAALNEHAEGARYLHFATHGWFAPEAFRSQLDELAEPSQCAALERAEETLHGFAPETLCGLALAGANLGRDALGHVPGILTAEELAAFDLRGCELAVLSACETNVGLRRAGQGIQSLQAALHAAGARTTITSLWRVDDAATRRLMEIFYTKLWKEGSGKAEALWQAKLALRDEGHPARDWAAWVLTGDPH